MSRLLLLTIFIASALAETMCVTAYGLNVRKGPSSSYAIVTELKQGAQVNTISKSGSWYKIGTDRWVSGSYLKPCGGSTGGNTGNTGSTSGKATTKCVTANTLNVRSGPGTSNSVVSKKTTGDKVYVYETKNGWSRIGTNQWVSAQYLGACPEPFNGDGRQCTAFWNKYSKTRYPTRQEYASALKSLVGKPIIYTKKGNRWHGINNKICPTSVPKYADCSSFTTWFYWTAFGKLNDLVSKSGWREGWTGSMADANTKKSISACEPGDFILYEGHAVTYVGNSRVVTYGADEGQTSNIREVDKDYRKIKGCYKPAFPWGQKIVLKKK